MHIIENAANNRQGMRDIWLNGLKVVIFLWVVLLPNMSWAWGWAGHAAVCEIAWQRSSPAVHRVIRGWLKYSPYKTFSQACSWPDSIRSQPQWAWSGPYHFINVPKTATHINKQRDCPDSACVLGGITRYTRQLQHANDLTHQEKWQALLFLAHYVGDVHQPLHVSYAEDEGGNRRHVHFQNKEYSLHQLWDSVLIKASFPHHGGQYIGRKLNHQISSSESQCWQKSVDAREWADESLQITRMIYKNIHKSRIDAEYVHRYLPVVEKRLEQAGVRLAWRLQQLLGKANLSTRQ